MNNPNDNNRQNDQNSFNDDYYRNNNPYRNEDLNNQEPRNYPNDEDYARYAGQNQEGPRTDARPEDTNPNYQDNYRDDYREDYREDRHDDRANRQSPYAGRQDGGPLVDRDPSKVNQELYGEEQENYAKHVQDVETERSSGEVAFLSVMNDIWAWLKAFFTSKPSSAVDKARTSKNPLSWVAMLVIYIIIAGLSKMFNAIQFNFNGYVWKSLLIGFLHGLLFYAAILIVVIIAQLIAGNLKRWYEPFNAAAAISMPRIMALVLTAIFGSFYSGFTIFMVDLISMIALLLTLFLLKESIKKDLGDRKSYQWTTLALLMLFILLGIAISYIDIAPVNDLSAILDLIK